jgi:hypothetical protein
MVKQIRQVLFAHRNRLTKKANPPIPNARCQLYTCAGLGENPPFSISQKNRASKVLCEILMFSPPSSQQPTKASKKKEEEEDESLPYLLRVLHDHVYVIHLRFPDRYVEHTDDIGVPQALENRDLAQCGDGDAVTAIRVEDAHLLEGDDLVRLAVEGTVDHTIGALAQPVEFVEVGDVAAFTCAGFACELILMISRWGGGVFYQGEKMRIQGLVGACRRPRGIGAVVVPTLQWFVAVFLGGFSPESLSRDKGYVTTDLHMLLRKYSPLACVESKSMEMKIYHCFRSE